MYVSFFPTAEDSEYTLKAWTGDNLESLVTASKSPIHTLPMEYNPVRCPIFIDATENLYIGFEINQTDFEYPAAIDQGPSVEGFSDLIYFEGEWLTLADYGFSNNWLIKAFVSEVNGPVAMQQLPGSVEKQNTGKSNHLQLCNTPIPASPT